MRMFLLKDNGTSLRVIQEDIKPDENGAIPKKIVRAAQNEQIYSSVGYDLDNDEHDCYFKKEGNEFEFLGSKKK